MRYINQPEQRKVQVLKNNFKEVCQNHKLLIMAGKYTLLEQELVKSLTERLLDFKYVNRSRNYFFKDVTIDHHIFDILSDHLWENTGWGDTISELVNSPLDANAFDRYVRERVYENFISALDDLN